MKLHDENLIAYIDGELDAETTREVEAALAVDAGARTRVQLFRDTTNQVREAFEGLIPQPVPQKLLKAVGTLEAKIASRSKAMNLA